MAKNKRKQIDIGEWITEVADFMIDEKGAACYMILKAKNNPDGISWNLQAIAKDIESLSLISETKERERTNYMG